MLIKLLLGIQLTSSAAFLDSWFNFKNFDNCTIHQFSCRNDKCISITSRCDGRDDCGDHSDEQHCDLYLCEGPHFFKCRNGRCISKVFVCDAENDCNDYSDEENCDSFKTQLNNSSSHCEPGQWQCMDKLCIPHEWVCNGVRDCLDGSDEESGCLEQEKTPCDQFRCSNGRCVPHDWRCDGHDDCDDGSDEKDCEHHVPLALCTPDNQKFLCSDNSTCLDITKVCNGIHDCPEGDDESPMCAAPEQSCKKHRCSHECKQLPSGPRCICPPGYSRVDQKTCKDVDECQQYGICDHKCRNTAGSYECYCEYRYFLNDKKTCKVIGGEAMMVFSSKTEIRAYTLESELYFTVASDLKQVVGVDYDGDHVYWSEVGAEHESIVRAAEDGSDKQVVATAGLSLPEDIAVDWLAGNVYFTDADEQRIAACSKDGRACAVLVSGKDVRKPRAITLNIDDGVMYWTDWDAPAAIMTAYMDGGNHRRLIDHDIHWPNGLALDYPNGRIYWTDAKKMTIESAKLDGTDIRVVLEEVEKHPYSLAVFEDRLYWSDWSTRSIQSCEKFTGKEYRTVIEDKQLIYGVSIFHPVQRRRKDNPCEHAACSDLCLLKDAKGYGCACPLGKVLSTDGHVCKDVDDQEWLLIGFNNTLLKVRHQVLGKFTSTSFPTVANHIGSMVYNAVNNSVFISDLDSKKIVEYSLDEDMNRLLEIDSIGWIISMDYDPFANNLYMCDAERNAVEVVSLKTFSRRILIRGTDDEIVEAVAIVPEEGTMFVAMRNPSSGKAHVDRMHMDGTGRAHTIEDDLVGPISLLYDAALHRIFIADAYSGVIESTSVDGDDRHTFRTLSANPASMATIKDELFWMNEHSKKLYWAKKVNSDYNKLITLDVPVRSISRPHIISTWRPVSQHYQNHPCSSGGNCSHLCLPVSSRTAVCACPHGYELSPEDNRTCIHRKTCSADQFSCWQSESCVPMHTRCDGHKDCAHGEDETGCSGSQGGKKCGKGSFTCRNGACIKESQVCDLRVDCPDKSDEVNCEAFKKKRTCPEEHFMCEDGECVSGTTLCDGFNDCQDGSDEKECHTTTCLSTQFRCDSGTCIPKSWECDHEFDCGDFSDEHPDCNLKYRHTDCPAGHFRCTASGRCVDMRLVCDGDDDCGDGSDEPPSCDLRRHQAASSCAGGFACPQGGECLPAIVRCNGTRECPKGEDEMGCEDRSEGDSNCRPDEFECKNKKCIPWQWACDKMADCEDESDETQEVCTRLNDTNIATHTVTVSAHVEHCNDGFRCKSGDCIRPLSLACDGKPDCYDGSDEGGKCKDACSKLACVHQCVPTPHGPMCQCHTGYRPTGDGRNCEDIDECSADPPVCSQICENEEGGYKCDCFWDHALRSDKKSCKAEGNPMSLVFLTANNQIRQLSQRTHRLSILFTEPIPRITGLGAVAQPPIIYFAVAEAGVLQKIDLKEDTSHVMQQVGEPQRLSVDWSTDNVYFAEGSTGGITVCHVASAKCAVMMMSSPESYHHLAALAVDAAEPAVFYAACGWQGTLLTKPRCAVYRRKPDGTDEQLLVKVDDGYVTELTFDHNKRQLYFLDRHNGAIVRVPYDGSGNSTSQQRTLFTDIFMSAAGLQFFEDHLYYGTAAGEMVKCALYGTYRCDMFKMHAGAASQFVILQDSLQRPVVDPCKNHTCRYLCVASSGAKSKSCLCQDGSLVSENEDCPTRDQGSSSNQHYKVHTKPLSKYQPGTVRHNGGGSLAAAILIPLALIIIAAIALFVLKKRTGGRSNITMRFHNQSFEAEINDDAEEKTILQPGLHEYMNPIVEFKDTVDTAPIVTKKQNPFVDV